MELNKIYQGEAKQVLQGMPDQLINTCVTSPPYWGLRDYGEEVETIWGGNPDCDHQWGSELKSPGNRKGEKEPEEYGSKEVAPSRNFRDSSFCNKCGAWRGQLGLEPTPELYTEHLTKIFHEIKRVLRDDGTLWLNLGDSYNGSGGAGGDYNKGGLKEGQNRYPGRNVDNLKQKDLVGIPWRVAFALQDDGWYLRNDIIWHKPNPMPESVTDRCTTSHEHIFLMSKSKQYYYDQDAIKEPAEYPNDNRGERTDSRRGTDMNSMSGKTGEKRNKRDVWQITTKPFPEAHFAVYPPNLIRPCIKAGCPEDGVVLDPFFGAGTTGLVAKEQGCNYVGIELNEDYIEMAKDRLSEVQKALIK